MFHQQWLMYVRPPLTSRNFKCHSFYVVETEPLITSHYLFKVHASKHRNIAICPHFFSCRSVISSTSVRTHAVFASLLRPAQRCLSLSALLCKHRKRRCWGRCFHIDHVTATSMHCCTLRLQRAPKIWASRSETLPLLQCNTLGSLTSSPRVTGCIKV